MKMKFAVAAATMALSLVAADGALALEPGLAPIYTPGELLGVPVALPLHSKCMLSDTLSFYRNEIRDSGGQKVGSKRTVSVNATNLTCAPGFQLFGGQYRFGLTLPYIHVTSDNSNFMYGTPGHGTGGDIASIDLMLADISWHLKGGWFLSAGADVYVPTGGYDADAIDPIGQPFWTFQPNVALSYASRDWLAGISAHYTINGRNKDTDYKTGNTLYVGGWAMRKFGNWSVGPGFYYMKQTTADVNDGTYYGGHANGNPRQFAAALMVSYQFANHAVGTVEYTHDVSSANVAGGDRLWLRLSVPLGGGAEH